jgi:DnaK suppressor protein
VNANFVQIRERLERRRADLILRSQHVARDLERAEGALSPDFSEQAVEQQNDPTLEAIARAALEEITQIDEALERVSQGEYGICKYCGQPIAPRRLAAIPQSTTCAKCPSR